MRIWKKPNEKIKVPVNHQATVNPHQFAIHWTFSLLLPSAETCYNWMIFSVINYSNIKT